MLTKLIIEKLNQSLHCNLTEAIECNFSDLLMHWKTHTHKQKQNKQTKTHTKNQTKPNDKTTATKNQNHKHDSEKGFQNVCQASPPWADHHH